jgi:hypothetical protein
MPTDTTPAQKPVCPHKRTQTIAKDNDAQYIECLDCGEIFEVGELPPASSDAGKGPGEGSGSGSGESLGDA